MRDYEFYSFTDTKRKNQILINSKQAFLNDGVLTSGYGSITFYDEQTVPYHLNEGQHIAKVPKVATCSDFYSRLCSNYIFTL